MLCAQGFLHFEACAIENRPRVILELDLEIHMVHNRGEYHHAGSL